MSKDYSSATNSSFDEDEMSNGTDAMETFEITSGILKWFTINNILLLWNTTHLTYELNTIDDQEGIMI